MRYTRQFVQRYTATHPLADYSNFAAHVFCVLTAVQQNRGFDANSCITIDGLAAPVQHWRPWQHGIERWPRRFSFSCVATASQYSSATRRNPCLTHDVFTYQLLGTRCPRRDCVHYHVLCHSTLADLVLIFCPFLFGCRPRAALPTTALATNLLRTIQCLQW